MYYNNTFDAFTNSGGQSAGTIIMGNNDGPNAGDGLRIKCNDYSNSAANDFDVAFTGVAVKIGDQQGSDADAQAPAGNSFANDCSDEQHFVNPEEDIAEFTYWHHDPSSTAIQIVPECATDPPIIVSGGSSWYEETEYQYVKSTVCPSFQELMLSMGDQLAIAASFEAGQQMAQSLAAEAHHYQQKAQAMHRLTTLALRDTLPAGLDSAIYAHKQHPLYTSARSLFGLYIAKTQLDSARQVVDVALEEDPSSVYWQVQDLYLSEAENEADPYTAAHLTGALDTMAQAGEYGSAHALAWLAAMGQHWPEEIILPSLTKRLSVPDETQPVLPQMRVFPNPSQGSVFVMVQVPEDAAQATLRVLDLMGRLMHERRVGNGNVTEELHLPLTTGFYLAVLYLNGDPAVSTKFQILH